MTENGTISYPLVGTVKIGGLTIPAAEQAIAKALTDGGFIQKPQVNIVLLKNLGNQVSVLGWVNRSGRYPLETFNTRISEMIAIAGGIMTGSVEQPGGADIMILTGTRDGKPFRREIDIPGMFLDNKLENDIVVAGGDVIYVHHAPDVLHLRRSAAPRFPPHRTRHDGAPGHRPEQRPHAARHRAPPAPVSPRRRRQNRSMSVPVLDDLMRPDDVLYVNESLF